MVIQILSAVSNLYQSLLKFTQSCQHLQQLSTEVLRYPLYGLFQLKNFLLENVARLSAVVSVHSKMPTSVPPIIYRSLEVPSVWLVPVKEFFT